MSFAKYITHCGYIVSKIISLVIFVCLAMWSIRNLKDHDVSYATWSSTVCVGQ